MKSVREGEILYIPYKSNLKINDTNELIKLKGTHRLREETYDCWGEGWGKGWLRILGWMCTHCYI